MKSAVLSPHHFRFARIVGGLLLVAGAAAVLYLHSARRALLRENRALQIELAASPLSENQSPAKNQAGNDPSSPEQFRELLQLRAEVSQLRQQEHDLTSLATENRQLRSNLLSEALEFGPHELNRQEVEAYLARHGRSAKSLLTASRLTHDTALLKEALTAWPNDPQVLLAAALQRDGAEQRRQRLEAFKQAAPNNALAHYLSAQNYFESGQTAQALQELAVGNGLPVLEDFSPESFRESEELFLSLGYSEAAAKAAAWNSREYSSLNQLAKLERSLRDLVKSSQQSGDDVSALLKLGLQLGQRLADDPAEFKTMDREGFGLAMQKRLLQTMDPGDTSGADRLADLERRRNEILLSQDPPGWDGYLLKHLSEQNVIGYFDRLRTAGELEARRWAVAQQKN